MDILVLLVFLTTDFSAGAPAPTLCVTAELTALTLVAMGIIAAVTLAYASVAPADDPLEERDYRRGAARRGPGVRRHPVRLRRRRRARAEGPVRTAANALFLLGPAAVAPGYALILPALALVFPYGALPGPRWRLPTALVVCLLHPR